jgi:hypothetical protein
MKCAEPQFVVCVKNKQYAASLELRKLYQVVPDDGAAKHRQLRVIDEWGEDYLGGAGSGHGGLHLRRGRKRNLHLRAIDNISHSPLKSRHF